MIGIPTHRPFAAQPRSPKVENPEARRFYNSRAWKRLRIIKLTNNPYCAECLTRGLHVPATHVHHEIEVLDRADLSLDLGNLISLCHSCHSRHHASATH